MRFRFGQSRRRRSSLQIKLEQMQQLKMVTRVLHSSLSLGFRPDRVRCAVVRARPDGLVVRAQALSPTGVHEYAVKVYADDFGRRVWDRARSLARHFPPDRDGLCLPIQYARDAGALVFPWVDGQPLSKIVDERIPELLCQAARIAAELHDLDLAPERPVAVSTIVAEAMSRCDRLETWPEAADLAAPLVEEMRQAATSLDPAHPAPVHGDLAPGKFIWTGRRLVLLGLDRFGYTDPAYDIGHFLAQLERRCVVDGMPPDHTSRWIASFQDAYLASRPQVSRRNVSFYRGLTLLRNVPVVCQGHPAEWPGLVPTLIERAWEEVRKAAAPVV